jgi:septal ring factor EnvC (AmiA/AmiB activator)
MTQEIKDVNKKIDAAEAAVKKYASKDTVISIGGYEFTPAKLMVAATIVSSVLGALYGTFEVYKSYQDMKTKIEKYVTPDLTEIEKKLAIVEENSQKSSDYTRDIKNDLRADIRKLEKIVEDVERSSKQSQREQDRDLRELRKEIDAKIQKALDNPLAGK